MRRSFTDNAKKIISLFIILLLTAVFCGSFEVSCNSLIAGGDISTGSGAISRLSIACSHIDLGRNAGGSREQEEFEETSSVFDIYGKTARKSLQSSGSGSLSESILSFKSYFVSICIISCAYLFLLTLVRFIHLKDGSK